MKVEQAKSQPSAASFFDRNEKSGRPMSPHLTIYKYQLTSMLSITHRFSGLALTGYSTALGLGALAFQHDFSYFVSAIEGMQLSCATLAALKFTLAVPITYHICNGIRHLMWDMGKFLTIKEVYLTGYIMLLSAFVSAAALAAM